MKASGVQRAVTRTREAIEGMAMHPGSLQERLLQWVQHLSSIIPGNDIDGELLKTHRAILDAATRIHPETVDIGRRYPSRVEQTCLTLTDTEAASIIRMICRFAEDLEEKLEELDRAGS